MTAPTIIPAGTPISFNFTTSDGAQFNQTVTYTPQHPFRFGNTPRGSSTAANVSIVDAWYAVKSKIIRLYCTGQLLAPAVTDRDVIGSFKTMPTSAQTSAFLANAAKYAFLFFQHEIDHKVIDAASGVSLPAWKTQMTILKSMGVANLAICLTADCFVNPAKNPLDYMIPGITHIAVDFDGVSPKPGVQTYHDYSAALAAVVAFCTKYGYTWGVPEFGANRASGDTSGVLRSYWLALWAGKFKAAGALYVCVWEQDGQIGSTFTTVAETATVSALLSFN